MLTAGVHFMVMAVVAVYSVLVSVSVLVTGCRNLASLRLWSSFLSPFSPSSSAGFDGAIRDRKSSSAVPITREDC